MHDVMMYCAYVHAEPHRLCCEHIYASSSRNEKGVVVAPVVIVVTYSSCIYVCNIYVCVIKLLKVILCVGQRGDHLYTEHPQPHIHTLPVQE